MKNAWIHGFLRAGLLNSVVKGKPYFVENSGLSPILTVEETVRIACRLIKTRFLLVNILDNGKIKYRGRNIIPPFDTPEKLNVLRDKATLMVNYVHAEIPALGDLCFLLGQELDKIVTANGYLGSNGSTALGLHPDDHDVILWQQHGKKLWEVRNPDDTQTVLKITMLPGSLFYIPERFPHVGETPPGEESLHLTFAAISRADAIRQLSALMKKVMAKKKPSQNGV